MPPHSTLAPPSALLWVGGYLGGEGEGGPPFPPVKSTIQGGAPTHSGWPDRPLGPPRPHGPRDEANA
ncbi:hypothetical protein E2C01_089737 [Portunus trituberculatus]|uniref:Uncharacterized protein n=1 Tax=Portunus trituberculatus TaxID=210409 RepID=A0A5B7JJL5_PORTR|nr:hypothetical protein [Portunus trituberculatus]